MKSKLALATLMGVVFIGGALSGTASIASAQTLAPSIERTQPRYQHAPAVYGKVTAVSGNTVTVLSDKDNTLYTVDLSNAGIMKFSGITAPTPITASDVSVGDTFAAHGTLSGTNIVATHARDGEVQRGRGAYRSGQCLQAQ